MNSQFVQNFPNSDVIVNITIEISFPSLNISALQDKIKIHEKLVCLSLNLAISHNFRLIHRPENQSFWFYLIYNNHIDRICFLMISFFFFRLLLVEISISVYDLN